MIEKDMLEQASDYRASIDPEYAKIRPKVEAVVKLVSLRARLALTQADVARRMGVSPSRVNEIESRPQTVSMDRIQCYAQAMGASFDLVLPDQKRTDGLDAELIRAKLLELADAFALSR